jgi:hypothetical protein
MKKLGGKMKSKERINTKSVVITFIIILIIMVLGYFGRTSVSRGCSNFSAKYTGADWIIVKTDLEGKPFRCWELRNVSIVNEENSDGIYWKDSSTGNLIHISGFYDRVQVSNNNWDKAFRTLNLTRNTCQQIRNTSQR